MEKPDFTALLRNASLKATPARLKLLKLLWSEEQPLAVHSIEKKLKGEMNKVTLYRALDALAKKGIIRRVDLGHMHAHYEMEKRHHHHMVCTNCNAVENIESPALERAVAVAGKSSRRFRSIYSHNLEFFGLCKECTK